MILLVQISGSLYHIGYQTRYLCYTYSYKTYHDRARFEYANIIFGLPGKIIYMFNSRCNIRDLQNDWFADGYYKADNTQIASGDEKFLYMFYKKLIGLRKRRVTSRKK